MVDVAGAAVMISVVMTVVVEGRRFVTVTVWKFIELVIMLVPVASVVLVTTVDV
jgi:hypothetical protein